MLITLLLLATIVIAENPDVEVSIDNATWQNATVVYSENETGTIVGLDPGTLYYGRARNSSTNWTYFSQRTLQGSEGIMAGLAIMGFITFITMLIFFLPSKIKKFTGSDLIDFVIRGSLYIIALGLLALDSAVLADVAANAGIEVTSEIFRFTWLLSWACVIGMGILLLAFGWKGLKMVEMKKADRQMGYT